MSSHEIWAGSAVLVVLFLWVVIERRVARRGLALRSTDRAGWAMLGRRNVSVREPAAGAQGASAPPARAAEPAAVKPAPAPVDLTTLRRDLEDSDRAQADEAPEPLRTPTTCPPPGSPQPPTSGAHVAVAPFANGRVFTALTEAGLGKHASRADGAGPAPPSKRPPPPMPPKRTPTLLGLSDSAPPPPHAPASRSPRPAPALPSRRAPTAQSSTLPPPPPQPAPAIMPGPSRPEDFDDGDEQTRLAPVEPQDDAVGVKLGEAPSPNSDPPRTTPTKSRRRLVSFEDQIRAAVERIEAGIQVPPKLEERWLVRLRALRAELKLGESADPTPRQVDIMLRELYQADADLRDERDASALLAPSGTQASPACGAPGSVAPAASDPVNAALRAAAVGTRPNGVHRRGVPSERPAPAVSSRSLGPPSTMPGSHPLPPLTPPPLRATAPRSGTTPIAMYAQPRQLPPAAPRPPVGPSATSPGGFDDPEEETRLMERLSPEQFAPKPAAPEPKPNKPTLRSMESLVPSSPRPAPNVAIVQARATHGAAVAPPPADARPVAKTLPSVDSPIAQRNAATMRGADAEGEATLLRGGTPAEEESDDANRETGEELTKVWSVEPNAADAQIPGVQVVAKATTTPSLHKPPSTSGDSLAGSEMP